MSKILKFIGIFILLLIILFVIYYYKSVGFTKKQKYYNCVEKCEELVFLESTKQYCPLRCEEVAGYIPKPEEEKPKSNKSQTDTATKQSSSAIDKNTDANTASDTPEKPYEEREYYCQWVWPQKIIDKQTNEVIVSCPSSYPWCHYADFKYENVECCKEKEYQTCLKLAELLK